MPRLDYSITNKDKHLSQQHHGFHMYMWSVWSCTCKWCEHFVTAFCCSQDARDPFQVPSSLCVYVVVIKTIYSVPFKVFPKMYNAQHLLRIASPLHKVKLVHTCADSTTWNRVCLYIRVVGIASSLHTYIRSITPCQCGMRLDRLITPSFVVSLWSEWAPRLSILICFLWSHKNTHPIRAFSLAVVYFRDDRFCSSCCCYGQASSVIHELYGNKNIRNHLSFMHRYLQIAL